VRLTESADLDRIRMVAGEECDRELLVAVGAQRGQDAAVDHAVHCDRVTVRTRATGSEGSAVGWRGTDALDVALNDAGLPFGDVQPTDLHRCFRQRRPQGLSEADWPIIAVDAVKATALGDEVDLPPPRGRERDGELVFAVHNDREPWW
jgi:hypothetical protein